MLPAVPVCLPVEAGLKLMIQDKIATSPTRLEDKFVTLRTGLKIRYVEVGPADAPALVLSHGFLGSLENWRYNIVPLAELSPTPLRVIAFDWPPFGESDKPEIAYSLFFYADLLRDFADALGLECFDLLGHSMGGKHNLAFTVLYPERVRKLVLVGSDGFIKDTTMADFTRAWWYRPVSSLFAWVLTQPRFLNAIQSRFILNPQFHAPVEEINAMAQFYRNPAVKKALHAMNFNLGSLSMDKLGLTARLKEVTHPVLLVWGLQDKVMHINCAHIAQERLPNAQLYVFDDAGHLPMVEKATEFNRLVLNFLAK